MQIRNKIFLLIITFLLLFLVFLPNLNANLTKEYIFSANILAKNGIINDNSKNPNNYRLTDNITRREMLKIMMNLSGQKVVDICEQKFSDLKPNDWGCKYAETALKLGYIAPNKSFRPDDKISKIESLKMILKAKGIEAYKTPNWGDGYVKKALEENIIENFTDYNTPAIRGWIFLRAGNIITKINNSQFKMCAQVITPAKNIVSGECLDFPNSCLPDGWQKVNSCVKKDLNYKKPKLNLSFVSAMDKKSVESNLDIYPIKNYSLNWIDDKNLEITLNDEINKEIEVLVNVLDEAKTSSGKEIDEIITKKFKVDGITKVDYAGPEGEITDTKSYITVRFSKPIVSLTNLDNQEFCPIIITPSLPGKCVWITTSTFQYRPEKGFPMGALYSIVIPAGVKSITGDKTLESKVFEIKTPEFKLLTSNNTNLLNKDEKLTFVFNDEVDLNKFKDNFSLEKYSLNNLNIEYFKSSTSIEGEYETMKNIITIFPVSGDWGYQKSFSYTIKNTLTSERGNIGLLNTINGGFTTNSFLINYSPFIYIDEKVGEKNKISNFKFSDNKDIITKQNPNILLEFFEEVPLDKSLFSLNYPFSLNYVFETDYNGGQEKLKRNKKKIVLNIEAKNLQNLTLKINTSKFSSSLDRTINFFTKNENKVLDYKFINYKKSCITFSNPIGYDNINKNKFIFNNEDNRINYIYEINNYSIDKDCKFKEGKFSYILDTRLNPLTDYKLIIKKDLIDIDNYSLDKEYSFSFKTDKALNEDKYVSIVDQRDFIILPSLINPLGVAISTINLDKVLATVCEGDFDITKLNFINNATCKSKEISLNNLGFKQNITVIDLKEVFGKDFSKKLINFTVSKLKQDKTEYELKDYFTPSQSFLYTDISAVLKGAKNNILWLRDYNLGQDLTDKISKIENYELDYNYSTFGNYVGVKYKKIGEISFTPKENGIYELSSKPNNNLLITLKDNSKVFIKDFYNYYPEDFKIYNYITTDKPIYKPLDKVYIKGISRILDAKGYKINKENVRVIVKDPKYKEILNKTLTLTELGDFEISFDLDKDASLGNYQISVGNNYLNFAVEEYEKPDFKIETKPTKNNYLLEEKAVIDISRDYYIGLPLQNGEGKYTLKSTEYNFVSSKYNEYYFGEQRYFWGYRGNYYQSDQNTIKTGNFSLDNYGKYKLNLDLEKDFLTDRNYILSTTITDPNTKKSISTSTTFLGLRSDTFLGMKFDKYYYAFKDKAKIDFLTIDIDSNIKPNKNFNLKVYKIDYIQNKNTFEIDKKETLILEKNLLTNTNGQANIEFSFDNYGEYLFEISLPNGKYKTTKTIYVSGQDLLRPAEISDKLDILSKTDTYKVGDNLEIVINSPYVGVKALLTVEKLDEILLYKVIDINSNTFKYFIDVKKEYLPNFDVKVYLIKDTKTSLSSFEKLKEIRAKMLNIEQKLQDEGGDIVYPVIFFDLVNTFYKIPNNNKTFDTRLLEELAKLRVEEQSLMQEIIPKYYEGQKTFKVDLSDIKLNSKIILDKITYLPGDKLELTLDVVDNEKKPISGNAMIKIIDESILALKNNSTPIIDFFYNEKQNQVQTKSNLENMIKRFDFANIKENLEKQIRDDGLFISRNKSLGGASLMDMTQDSSVSMTENMAESAFDRDINQEENSNATKLRTEFKDIVYFKGIVKVKNGKAKVVVDKLPDNLTTWVISGFVHTLDTKLTNIEDKFLVQKPLSLTPVLPRFFITGDIMQVGALVNNTTNKTINAILEIDASNINLKETKKTVNIEPNSSKLVVFDAEVISIDKNINYDNVFSNIVFSLNQVGGNYADKVELKRKINPYSTPEYTFTNGSTYDLSYEEKIVLPENLSKVGSLDISIGASILTNLFANLDSIIYFPGEDLYSKLDFIKRYLALKDIYNSANKITDFENILIYDYKGKGYKLKEVYDLVLAEIPAYKQADNGFSYFKDCFINYYRETCSDRRLTKEFLNLNLKVPGIDNNAVYNYYKDALIKEILENKNYGIKTIFIDDFLIPALYKDFNFINTYFKPNLSDLSNLEKLNYIKLYDLLGTTNENYNKFLNDIKNAIKIEARGSFVPANSNLYYFYGDNSLTTAKALELFISKKENEKLIIENFVRWLLSNRDENGGYYSQNVVDIIKSINSYINYTDELKDISFEAKGYLNSKELISQKFDDKNKFEIYTKKFDFSEYLKFGQENSLGFQKTGNQKLYYDVGLRYYLPINKIQPRDEGIIVSRQYYNYEDYKNAYKTTCFNPWWNFYGVSNWCNKIKIKNLESISKANKGDYIVGEITITVPQERNNIIVNNFIPAGTEILNINLDTTSDEVKELTGNQKQTGGGYDYFKTDNYYTKGIYSKPYNPGFGRGYYPYYSGFDFVEIKDNQIFLYASHLKSGTYKYTYVLKANHIGVYSNPPAVSYELKKPEIWGRSVGNIFEIK